MYQGDFEMSEIKLVIERIERNEKNVTPAFCFDDCIATRAKSYGADFRLLYINRLRIGFDTENDDRSIGERVRFGYDIDAEMKELLGIECEAVIGKENAIALIGQELSDGNAVMFGIEGYYCPWDWRYGTIRGEEHMLFATGIDISCGDYICADPYYNKPRELLTKELLENGITGVVLTKHTPKNESEDIETLLGKYLDISYCNSYAPLTGLADACRKSFSLEREIEGWQCGEALSIDRDQDRLTLNRVCKEIVHDRVRFSAFMKYLSEKTNKTMYDELSKEFAALSDRWNLFRLQMLRKVFSGRTENIGEYIADRLDSVIAEEYRLVDRLKSVLSGSICSAERKSEAAVSEFCMDISAYFNNEGIGTEESHADLNGEGEFFLMDKFPSGRCVECDIASFGIAQKNIGTPDNIKCEGQSIEIGRKCRELILLGCSDYDQCSETITLVYSDSSSEKQTLSFEDWMPDYGRKAPKETVLTIDKVTCYPDGSSDTDEEGSLYYCVVPVDRNRIIEKMILPCSDNMHIFAITVRELS